MTENIPGEEMAGVFASPLPGKVTPGRNRPTLYIPGFSQTGSYMHISERSTPDGPLILGQEVVRPAFNFGGRSGHLHTEDIDSGVESSFSMLSIAEPEENTSRGLDRTSPSVRPDAQPLPIFQEFVCSSIENTDNDELNTAVNCSNDSDTAGNNSSELNTASCDISSESASFLEEADKLLEYTSQSDDFSDSPTIDSLSSSTSVAEICSHGCPSDQCIVCVENKHSLVDSRLSLGLNTGQHWSSLTNDIELSPVDGDKTVKEDEARNEPILGKVCNADENKTSSLAPPIKKEILSFPLSHSFEHSSASPVLLKQKGNNYCRKAGDGVTGTSRAFEKSIVPPSEMFSKLHLGLFSCYKSPTKYSPQKLLSPSAPCMLVVGGVERMCAATQTGHQGDGDNGLVQYLPGLDGRIPGSPQKERIVKVKYLSPVSLDSRTTTELWEDIVHNSERKLRERIQSRRVFLSTGCQTDSNSGGSSQFSNNSSQTTHTQASGDACCKHMMNNSSGTQHSTTDCLIKPIKSDSNSTFHSIDRNECVKRSLTPGSLCPPHSRPSHRRLFSELPVTSQSYSIRTNLNTSSPRDHVTLPSTPVQDRKRIKSHDSVQDSDSTTHYKGRAIRKSNCLKDTSMTRKAKVRAIRPRHILPGSEADQNHPPSTSSVSMETSPCCHETKVEHCRKELFNGNDSIDVTLNIKTSTPVKTVAGVDSPVCQMDSDSSTWASQHQKSGTQAVSLKSSAKTPSYFSPLLSSTVDEDLSPPDPSPNLPKGRRLRPMNARSAGNGVASPPALTSTPPSLSMNIETNIKLSPPDLDTLTKIHTICNGQRLVEYINYADSPMVMVHYPPPKEATRVQWRSEVDEADSPRACTTLPPPTHCPGDASTPTRPKPILTQRSESFRFPFSDEAPSPILLTKVRRQNLLSKGMQHTQL